MTKYSLPPVINMSTLKPSTTKQEQTPRGPRREKKPPLTHFLCLPLVNTESLPQLEASLAAFAAAHCPPVAKTLADGQPGTQAQDDSICTIPQGAIRPVGTIHLTLGVMSLPTKERLNEAISFFNSLDLASLMREAARVSRESLEKRRAVKTIASAQGTNASMPGCLASSDTYPSDSEGIHGPIPSLSVSLESLHALPRAKAATVLHASPVDSTGRLYPFCVMLRDKFIEAGFILNEAKSETSMKTNDSKNTVGVENPPCKDLQGDQSVFRKEFLTSSAETEPTSSSTHWDPYAAALARKPKPRPLLLHATLINTIYVRGREKAKNGSHGRNGSSKRFEFDARSILNRYRNYYIDQTRSIPVGSRSSAEGDGNGDVDAGETCSSLASEEEKSQSNHKSEESCIPDTPPTRSKSQPLYPFVWARNVPIGSVCICEMGAKKLESGGAGEGGLNARLGEQYIVVAERRIDAAQPPVQSSSPCPIIV
ncbi:hypothetical protein POX_f08042 [Penicillium oxalicum]|uniref:hypothetical protein n=1 Tax=Penicillium oxalicum TaxID=69781 RepID=UPI0020B66BC9|nr:hypothetical protein POX_f08042 [Penicillium oxalicum]KAI2787667.1 hypothetical protein POX_f08042 [Penicillium oxalicum]